MFSAYLVVLIMVFLSKHSDLGGEFLGTSGNNKGLVPQGPIKQVKSISRLFCCKAFYKYAQLGLDGRVRLVKNQ